MKIQWIALGPVGCRLNLAAVAAASLASSATRLLSANEIVDSFPVDFGFIWLRFWPQSIEMNQRFDVVSSCDAATGFSLSAPDVAHLLPVSGCQLPFSFFFFFFFLFLFFSLDIYFVLSIWTVRGGSHRRMEHADVARFKLCLVFHSNRSAAVESLKMARLFHSPLETHRLIWPKIHCKVNSTTSDLINYSNQWRSYLLLCYLCFCSDVLLLSIWWKFGTGKEEGAGGFLPLTYCRRPDRKVATLPPSSTIRVAVI